MTTIPFIQ